MDEYRRVHNFLTSTSYMGTISQFSRPGRRQYEQILHINVQRFRGGLVFEAGRLLYHSTPGLRVTKKKKKKEARGMEAQLSLNAMNGTIIKPSFFIPSPT